MRRVVLSFLALAALAAPASVLAAHDAAGDGTLVVKNGSAPHGVAVVNLTITGSVIGQVADGGKIVIDAGLKGPAPEVTGANGPYPNKLSDTAQQWNSPDGFKFRAVGGHFTILIYGAGVNLVAVGNGSVTVSGMPDIPLGDGRFSINGGDFTSLPGSPVKRLIAGDTNG